jgi:hypothetical protein
MFSSNGPRENYDKKVFCARTKTSVSEKRFPVLCCLSVRKSFMQCSERDLKFHLSWRHECKNNKKLYRGKFIVCANSRKNGLALPLDVQKYPNDLFLLLFSPFFSLSIMPQAAKTEVKPTTGLVHICLTRGCPENMRYLPAEGGAKSIFVLAN